MEETTNEGRPRICDMDGIGKWRVEASKGRAREGGGSVKEASEGGGQ